MRIITNFRLLIATVISLVIVLSCEKNSTNNQSFIEIDEEGTDAAAATVVEIRFTSAGPDAEPLVWKVDIDRPFLYFIHEIYTGTLLFMGRVSDPAAE